jgi:CheY-like chemotaxis protein
MCWLLCKRDAAGHLRLFLSPSTPAKRLGRVRSRAVLMIAPLEADANWRASDATAAADGIDESGTRRVPCLRAARPRCVTKGRWNTGRRLDYGGNVLYHRAGHPTRKPVVPHLLVADDDAMVCEAITDCLQLELRARVDCALSGHDARKLMTGYQYDLALIDALLPDIDGFRLAELAANENIPVVLTSGHPGVCDRLIRFDFPHLHKPYSFDTLIGEATRVIQGARENIRRVRDASSKMRAHTEALAAAVEDARRLMAETRAARMRTERKAV